MIRSESSTLHILLSLWLEKGQPKKREINSSYLSFHNKLPKFRFGRMKLTHTAFSV